jgi:hypothetical protein
MIVTAGFLMVDIGLIVLAAIWPATFGKALFIYGLALFIPGLLTQRVLRVGTHSIWDKDSETDWTVSRWPVMIALIGLACVLAYCSLVLPRQG